MRRVKKLIIFILISVFICSVNVQASTVFKSNNTSKIGDYVYELWKDTGTTTIMTIEDDGEFSCEWSNINEAMFFKGKMNLFDKNITYNEIKSITVDFDCEFESEGGTYIGVTGGSQTDILLMYYIIEYSDDWHDYKDTYSKFMGSITVDGASYDVYMRKLPYHDIMGRSSYYFYYSVRTSGRTSGTVNVLEHFRAWESLGMKMFNTNNAFFTVGGTRSKGKAKVNHVSIDIDYYNYKLGDVNGDGNTDSMDFALLRSYLVGSRDLSEYEYGQEAADVNRDGDVNSLDFALLKSYLLGKIQVF